MKFYALKTQTVVERSETSYHAKLVQVEHVVQSSHIFGKIVGQSHQIGACHSSKAPINLFLH